MPPALSREVDDHDSSHFLPQEACLPPLSTLKPENPHVASTFNSPRYVTELPSAILLPQDYSSPISLHQRQHEVIVLSPTPTGTNAFPTLSAFPRPLLLPPNIPIQSGTQIPVPTQPSPHMSNMHRVEIIFIASVVLLSVFVGLVAASLARIIRMNVRGERLEVQNIWNPRRWFGSTLKECIKMIKKRGQVTRRKAATSQRGSGNSILCPELRGKNETTRANCPEDKPSSGRLRQKAADQGRPSLHTIQEEFDERLHEQEADIALALKFGALRDHSSPVILSDDGECWRLSYNTYTMLSPRAGIESAGKRAEGVRTWISLQSDKSEASRDENVAYGAETFYEEDSSRSSMTSMTSDSLGRAEEKNYGMFESRKALTRGVVLMPWRLSDHDSFKLESAKENLDMPTLVISNTSPVIHGSYLPEIRSGLLHPPIPSLPVTTPKNSLLNSSISSVSVNLNDFPSPPSLFGTLLGTSTSTIPTEIDNSLVQEHDLSLWNGLL